LSSDPEKKGFIIYRSSAGSGKTYSLALEFISLCIADPGLYNKILAVTFTNKATREMKERIIGNLEKLSINSDPDLMKDIKKKTGSTEDIVKERAAKVLDNILHNYSQLSISTIDAFFQKIVKAFAKELGLMGNFSVELDQGKVLDEVIDLLIEDVGSDKELTEWLIDFSTDAVESGEAWDIRRKIKKFASELLKETNSTSGDGEAMDYRTFLDDLKKIRTRFEKEMSQRANEALTIVRDHHLSIDDFSNKMSGPAGYLVKVSQKKEFIPGKRFTEAVADESKWFTKNSPLIDTIRMALKAGLLDKAVALMNFYLEHHQAYFSAVQVIGNFYLYGILAKLSAKLHTYRQVNDIMLISDVPVFLQKIIAENEAPFIYEKTGSWYRHYLIDEFQDTSGFQWNNFRPLVENGLSQGHKSLLVGDGKQSIYRWRGGDWSLILHQVEQDLNRNHIVKKNLQTNWRSEANIVEFNNALYQLAPDIIADNLYTTIELPDVVIKEELHNSVRDIRKLYEGAKQEISVPKAAEYGGDVLIKVFEKDTENKWNDLVLEQLPADIERVQDLGYSAGQIAILVRRAEEGRMVIEQLLKHKNSMNARSGYTYDAISGESLFIGKSPAVRLLVNCLKYCANPADDLVLADIQYSHYLVRNAGIGNPDMDTILSENSLPMGFQQICANVASQPVFDMVEKFIRLFELNQENLRGYIEAFQNEVLNYFSDRTKNLNDFLTWWDEDGCLKSLAAMDSGDAIRVMTIHKSKGLEFGAVIIPFCAWQLSPEPRHGIILWCETEKPPYAGRCKFPLKYSSALEKTYFARNYFQEMILGNIDNLNLLYVATTRAESYLQINCPPESDKLTTSGDLVAMSVKRLCELTESPLKLLNYKDEFNNNCYRLDGQKRYSTKKTDSVKEIPSQGYRSTDWRQKVQIRSGARDIDAGTIPEWKARISYGILIHELLADVSGQEEALLKLESRHRNLSLTEVEYGKAKAQINRIFSNALVLDWFHPRWTVKREAEIISGKGRSKRPDRVIIDGKKAIIIDFKTGQARDNDRRQVKYYTNLMKEMGFESVEGYLLYTEQGEVEKVV
jgi:ATP-dependent exoDNAse (exonuclease V) beta subunit